MDGWQLVRVIRSRAELKQVPMLFLTRLRGETSGSRDINSASDGFRPQAVGRPARSCLRRVDRVAERVRPVAATPSATVPAASPGPEDPARTRASLASLRFCRFSSSRKKTGVLRLVPRTPPPFTSISGGRSRSDRRRTRRANLARAALRAARLDARPVRLRVIRWVPRRSPREPSPRFC